jgi:hypothetical protein
MPYEHALVDLSIKHQSTAVVLAVHFVTFLKRLLDAFGTDPFDFADTEIQRLS